MDPLFGIDAESLEDGNVARVVPAATDNWIIAKAYSDYLHVLQMESRVAPTIVLAAFNRAQEDFGTANPLMDLT